MKMTRARVGRKPSRKPFTAGLRSTTPSRNGIFSERACRVVSEATKATGMTQMTTRAPVTAVASTERMDRDRLGMFMFPQCTSRASGA